MPKCDKCNVFLPPGFIHTEHPKTGEPLKGAICLFCIEGKQVIKYDHDRKQVSKRELEREYDIFLKKVKEDNSILKDGAKGKYVKGAEKIIL